MESNLDLHNYKQGGNELKITFFQFSIPFLLNKYILESTLISWSLLICHVSVTNTYHVVPVELLSCKIVAKVTHPQKDIISVENSRYCFHTLLAIFVKHTTYV